MPSPNAAIFDWYLDALHHGDLETQPELCPTCDEACATEIVNTPRTGPVFYCESCGTEWNEERTVFNCSPGGDCGVCNVCVEEAAIFSGDLLAGVGNPYTSSDDVTGGGLHTLYRFFAADGGLLYVGLTKQPWARFKQHAHDKPWWTLVASATLQHYPTREALQQAEKQAIADEEPRYNIAGRRQAVTNEMA